MEGQGARGICTPPQLHLSWNAPQYSQQHRWVSWYLHQCGKLSCRYNIGINYRIKRELKYNINKRQKQLHSAWNNMLPSSMQRQVQGKREICILILNSFLSIVMSYISASNYSLSTASHRRSALTLLVSVWLCHLTGSFILSLSRSTFRSEKCVAFLQPELRGFLEPR